MAITSKDIKKRVPKPVKDKLKSLGLGPTPKPKPKAKPAAKAAPAAAARKPAAAPAPKVYTSARAERPIGIFYDELSHGINPFSVVETHGVADVTDSPEHIAELFNRYGLVKLRRLYSPEKSLELYENCIDFSGVQPMDFRAVFNKDMKWGTGGAPAMNDKRFWPFVVEEKLKQVIQLLLGENTFEFGSSVAAHYSARGLHRDYRMLVEEATPYSIYNPTERIVRVLHYCGRNGGALGFIPFSHDEAKFAEVAKEVGLPPEYNTAWFDRHRDVLTQARLQKNFVEADEIERHVNWAYADPGDVIISNSAMLHAGEYLTGPRYFFVSTYAKNVAGPVGLATSGKGHSLFTEYYQFLLDSGFKGAADVLSNAEKQKAEQPANASDPAMGGMGMGGA